ncbi:hypothetical protein OOJ96_22415 [Pseudomonas sp. 15FMM2]|uniref:Uncharacterized protein n=1 Tax=Pseudomonas imrae TaxID=2992837 RepID=A0ACC7PKA5_9PSED
MDVQTRGVIADQLAALIRKTLAPQLCTGTAKQMRERSAEMLCLMARVTAATLHEGPADTELLFRIRRYEAVMGQWAEDSSAALLVVK